MWDSWNNFDLHAAQLQCPAWLEWIWWSRFSMLKSSLAIIYIWLLIFSLMSFDETKRNSKWIPVSFFVGIFARSFASFLLVELDKLQSFWVVVAWWWVMKERERERIDGNIYGWHLIIPSETFFMCNFKTRYQNFPLTFCCPFPPF